MEVGGWLRRLGLEQYEAAFRENEIDDTVLPSLTAADLKDLGVAFVGHRRKLLNAINWFNRKKLELNPKSPLRRGRQDTDVSCPTSAFGGKADMPLRYWRCPLFDPEQTPLDHGWG
jgi:hypothetical protein